MSQQRLPTSLLRKVKDNNSLFSGIWIQWSALTIPERVVCANIVLLPAWWVAGLYRYMPTFILLGIALYEQSHYGGLRLKRPSFSVVAFLAFCTYQCVGALFFGVATDDVSLTGLLRLFQFWFPVALLLWYIQSNDIRIRPEVAAWACSVSVVQMIGFWLVGHFIFGERPYVSPRTLFSIISGNAEGDYVAGKGLGNYLIPYRPQDRIISGLARWSFFFVIPELSALVAGFIALLALDIRNRVWSLLLLVGSLFLLLVSGTRSTWIMLPAVVGIRFFFKIGQTRGFYIPLALIAMVSFVTLSLPPVTDSISSFFEETTESVGEARADSTEVRSEIYKRTIERIPDNLILGHWVSGETVVPGFDIARVGSHSFILGSLLYRLGLIGTLLFIVFWISLFVWFYQTREGRPSVGYCLLIFYTLLCVVMEFGEPVAVMIPLLSAAIRSPKVEIERKMRYL